MASQDLGIQTFPQSPVVQSPQSDRKLANQGHSKPSQSGQGTTKPQTDAVPQLQALASKGLASNQPPSYGDPPAQPTPQVEAPSRQSGQTEPPTASQQGQETVALQPQIAQIPSIMNRFTEEIGLKCPIVICAPIADSATQNDLVDVINTGGMAILVAGNASAKDVTEFLKALKHRCPDKEQAIGVEFNEENLNSHEGSPLSAALEQKVGSIWFSDIEASRNYAGDVSMFDAEKRGPDSKHKTKVFIRVQDVAEVKEAIFRTKVDGIVIQGDDKNAWVTRGDDESVWSRVAFRLKSTLSKFPRIPNRSFVLAEGCNFTGAHIAEMLILGAAGSVFTFESSLSTQLQQGGDSSSEKRNRGTDGKNVQTVAEKMTNLHRETAEELQRTYHLIKTLASQASWNSQ